MTGNAIVANDTLTNIADAINTKAGTSGQMTVQEMAQKISQIMSTNQTEKNAVKTAINVKNPTVAPTDEISQWPTSIASIPSGSTPTGMFVLTGSATSVGAYEFTSSHFTTVSLPACTSVGYGAFGDSGNLTSVSLPVCTSVGNRPFYCCDALTAVLLPVCTSVGECTFYSCTNLTSISLPACTSVGEGTFYSCTNLTSINLQSLTVAQVTAGASDWCIPSGCVVQCKDGTYTQQ